jgi:hypothetical protein
MNEQNALNLARQLMLKRGFSAGTPSSKNYHPEGGKSLENVQRISNYQSLLDIPYWELVFNDVGGGQIIVIVFENERVLLVTTLLPTFSIEPAIF